MIQWASSRLAQFDLPDVTILVDRLTSSYVVSELLIEANEEGTGQ